MDESDKACRCCTQVLLSCNLLEIELLAQSAAMEKLRGEIWLFLGHGCAECARASIERAADRLDCLAEYIGEPRRDSIVDAAQRRLAASLGHDNLWHVVREGTADEQNFLRADVLAQHENGRPAKRSD